MQADKGSFFQRAALGHATRAAIIAAALTLAGAQVIAAEVADRVLHGGKVYTLNSDAPWAEAVAIRGDRILYVGDNAGVAAFTGPGTDTVDLGGRLVLPGFIDSHMHIGSPICTSGYIRGCKNKT